jgi:hypothetical protein
MNPENYNWLNENDYNKLLFRIRANVAKILSGLMFKITLDNGFSVLKKRENIILIK